MNIAMLLLSISMLLAPLLAAIPEEPQWSSFLGAAVLVSYGLILMSGRARAGRTVWLVTGIVGWSILSLLANMSGLAFLSHMLHMVTVIATYVCAFLAMRRLAVDNRGGAFAVVLAAIVGATIMSVIGMQEFLGNLRDHHAATRINGPSTPDFLAGYLVMLAPIAIAAFLAIPRGNSLRLLVGIAAFLQTATIFPTGSRFAIVSIAAAVIAFAAGVIRSGSAQGRKLKFSPRAIIGTLAILALIAVVARPIIHRLKSGGNDNSGQFRVYTWHGTVDMAVKSPLFGKGPGTFIDHYPQFARAGFTRLAHETYLQTAAEMGFPELLLMAALIVLTVSALWRYLGSTPSAVGESSGPFAALGSLPASSYPPIAAGLLAAIVGEAVQNFIDSDLYVFSIGVTFWALLGMAAGLVEADKEEARPVKAPALKWAVIAVVAVAAVYSVMNGLAAHDATLAQSIIADPNGAAADAVEGYRNAESLAPLDGKYPAELGYRALIGREGDNQGGIAEIRKGVARQPDSQNYLRLGEALTMSKDMPGATQAYLAGLKQDPNRVEILIALIQLSTPADAVRYSRRLADIEQSPVGKVRAIGEMNDFHFALGDIGVADDAAARGDKATAVDYYRRALRQLQQYANQDGSNYLERMVENGGNANPSDDKQAAAWYDHAAGGLLTLLTGPDRDKLAVRMEYTDALFERALGDASKATGDLSDAKSAYQAALSILSTCPDPRAPALKTNVDGKIQSLSQSSTAPAGTQ